MVIDHGHSSPAWRRQSPDVCLPYVRSARVIQGWLDSHSKLFICAAHEVARLSSTRCFPWWFVPFLLFIKFLKKSFMSFNSEERSDRGRKNWKKLNGKIVVDSWKQSLGSVMNACMTVETSASHWETCTVSGADIKLEHVSVFERFLSAFAVILMPFIAALDSLILRLLERKNIVIMCYCESVEP